jgi:membrane protein implicated in regulation of membrane protease activity
MTTLWTLWWVWLGAAIVLGGVEILVPGFVALGFAIGALVVALLVAIWTPGNLAFLLLIFAAASLAAWLVLRRLFSLPKGSVKTFDYDVND